MKLKKCRVCNSSKFINLFSLGKLSFTGKFARSTKINIPKDFLNLIICKKCKLVQLDRNFDPKYLYSKDYGYRTGINKTMTEHVKFIADSAIKIVKPKKNDMILDIASNDATLLNFYSNKFITVGIDPLVGKYKMFYKKINFKISNFFSLKELKKKMFIKTIK